MNARYAWILYGWYSEEWWRSSDEDNCSEEQLAAVLEKALVLQQYPIADTSDGAVGGLVRIFVSVKNDRNPQRKILKKIWNFPIACLYIQSQFTVLQYQFT